MKLLQIDTVCISKEELSAFIGMNIQHIKTVECYSELNNPRAGLKLVIENERPLTINVNNLLLEAGKEIGKKLKEFKEK